MIGNIFKRRNNMTNHATKSPSHIRPLRFVNETNVNILQNSKFQFAQKHALSLYSPEAIYSFIPKNGCTSLRTSIAAANGFFQYKNPSEHINWVHNNTYTFSAQLRELVTAKYTFTILRCPYSRLASLFLDKFVDKTPVAWNFFRQTNNTANLDEISFHDFILKLQQPNLINTDIHWRKQTDFLIYENYDDYFDFDDFNTIQNTLAQKINLDTIDTRMITHHGREKYTNISGNFSNETTTFLKNMKCSGELPNIDSMYTDKLRKIVKELYSQDFKLIDEKLKKNNT